MSRALMPFPRLVRAAVLVAAAALAVAVPRAGRADDPASLGQLERETLADGMERLGVAIDPHPQGKRVGLIRVVNEEVFSKRDWLLQLLNMFHRTSRDWAVSREVLLRPGQLYDQDLVDETIRNLRAPPSTTIGGVVVYQPELSSVVTVVPVVSSRPGEVDLLVVTRDIWSLRFNTNFEFQADTLTLLDTSLSENNLFGWRKFVSARFYMDQGAFALGPTYFDPNVHGTHLTLLADASLWYSRETERYDGNRELFSLRYPLYSLASKWGGGVDVNHYDTVVRTFRGSALLLYEYRQRLTTVDASAVRSFASTSGTSATPWIIQRVTAGYLVDSRRYSVLPDFLDPSRASAFLSVFAPISEQRSEPYARYEVFTPRYVVLRDLDTFDLRETFQVGPHLATRLSYGVPALGADFTALGLSAAGSWAWSRAGGYAKAGIIASTRLRDGRFIDQSSTEELYLASPMLGNVLRVVTDAQAGATRADTQNTRFFLGGTTGLRGYAVNELEGTSFLLWHVELRSQAAKIFSQRVGGLLFYDGGGVAASYSQLVTYHDFGVGLRWLIPQANSYALRFDWAVATADATLTRAGFPGRFTAGFQQVFDQSFTKQPSN